MDSEKNCFWGRVFSTTLFSFTLMQEPLIVRPEGLYCPSGDFYIDPRGKVERAMVTHAHSDHARPGHNSYLVSQTCLPLLKLMAYAIVMVVQEIGSEQKTGKKRTVPIKVWFI